LPLQLPFDLPAVGHARAVPITHVFAWYEEALRLFKRAPFGWCLLGLITLGSEQLLQLVPGIGVAAAKVIVPVVECGMLIAAAALDHGAPLRLRYAFSAFSATPGALAAIVGSELVVFAATAIAAYLLADVNVLVADTSAQQLSVPTVVGILTTTMVFTLPLTFVPFAALFGSASLMSAIATGWSGFVLNVLPLTLFGVFALVLVTLGMLTYGIGLIAVFPLLSAASYVAWKDVFPAVPAR